MASIMTPPKRERIVEKHTLGQTRLLSKVIAQIETCRGKQYRILIFDGVDLVHTSRVATTVEGLEKVNKYVKHEYGELQHAGLRVAQLA